MNTDIDNVCPHCGHGSAVYTNTDIVVTDTLYSSGFCTHCGRLITRKPLMRETVSGTDDRELPRNRVERRALERKRKKRRNR